MNIKRIFTLLGKELLHGPRGFILTMTIAAPLLITLVVNLALGDLFGNTAQMAIFDEGQSQLVFLLEEASQLHIAEYDSSDAVKDAVSRGAADFGIVLPADFDSTITSDEKVAVTTYIWGESLAKNRTIITATLLDLTHQLSSQPEPIILESITLGDEETIPWSRRLMPMTVMMAIFFGGLMLPATSLIEEKQKRTLQALAVTPASLPDIFIAKGIMGAILSLVMGTIILLINLAWGNSPFFLLLTLTLGAVMAAEIGLILGTLINDMNTLFAVWKFGGLLLFGPAIIYMFPELPQWLNYIFPTYYVTGPIMDISLGTMDTQTLMQLAIALGVILILALLQSRLINRLSGEVVQQATKESEATG
ncbi:MAG: ABC transporter permease [Dehalococcoidales bacterium]|nr:ABC transporter permease [Dehalococcoidales bacterium]